MRDVTRALAGLLVAALAGGFLSTAAWAHPSDLGTLTLDLLVDRGGVVLVDAAAPRVTDQDRPSEAERRALAGDVLDALGGTRDTVEVDPASSLLYHEVGFTMWLHSPLANTGVPGEVRVDTRPLQDLAATRSARLLLDVCRVAFPAQRLVVHATRPESPPAGSGAGSADWDRRDCAAWSLAPEDAAVTITARVEGAVTAPAPRTLELPCGPPSDLDPRSTPVLASFALVGAQPLHTRDRQRRASLATGRGGVRLRQRIGAGHAVGTAQVARSAPPRHTSSSAPRAASPRTVPTYRTRTPGAHRSSRSAWTIPPASR